VTCVTEVLIVDDHAIVRQGLRQVVSETADIIVTGEAETGAAALRLLREKPFSMVLLDISMPDRNGIDVLKQIRREFPKLSVIILTMHAEDEFGVRALKAGASGYLTKQSAPAELVNAIRQVASGRKYISPLLAEELARHVTDGGERMPHENLSDREFQTLCLIGSGKSLSQVAADLCLSPKTVSVYRARLLEKLNLKNNAELTHYAIRNHLVS
jgi:two-component system, NarL family, invasion response regulator UvrY